MIRAVVDTNVLFEGLTHLGPAAEVVDAWVANDFQPRAQYVPIRYSHRPASPDPGDDFVIDCVVNSRSILITSNVRDFEEASGRLGFAVLRPPDFLRLLKEMNPT